MWHRCLRPAVGIVSRYRHDPNKGHWQTVKWVLWYLLKTVDVGFVFEQVDTCDQYATGFVDSNCVGYLDKWNPFNYNYVPRARIAMTSSLRCSSPSIESNPNRLCLVFFFWINMDVRANWLASQQIPTNSISP